MGDENGDAAEHGCDDDAAAEDSESDHAGGDAGLGDSEQGRPAATGRADEPLGCQRCRMAWRGSPPPSLPHLSSASSLFLSFPSLSSSSSSPPFLFLPFLSAPFIFCPLFSFPFTSVSSLAFGLSELCRHPASSDEGAAAVPDGADGDDDRDREPRLQVPQRRRDRHSALRKPQPRLLPRRMARGV
eukprot:1088565-Rhodomonas_salina.5